MVRIVFITVSLLLFFNQKVSAQILISAGPDLILPLNAGGIIGVGFNTRAEFPISKRWSATSQFSYHAFRTNHPTNISLNILSFQEGLRYYFDALKKGFYAEASFDIGLEYGLSHSDGRLYNRGRVSYGLGIGKIFNDRFDLSIYAKRTIYPPYKGDNIYLGIRAAYFLSKKGAK